MGSDFPDIEASSSILQCKFPPYGANSVHLSVNLPDGERLSNEELMGLCVIDTHGARLSFPRSLVRSLLKFVPWELTHACLWHIPGWPLAPTTPSPIITAGLVLVWVLVAAYLVSMLVSKKHQALYDWIAGIYVIVAPHPGRTQASEKQAR